jgi:hypothetical protein
MKELCKMNEFMNEWMNEFRSIFIINFLYF